MNSVRQEFLDFLSSFDFKAPQIPVIANATARPYPAAGIMEILAQQIDHPVRWTESIHYLIGEGIAEFVEIGPGNILTGLLRQIKSSS
jgi:polyketide biosynthesis malonyl-CoA-[acyl-carrier-protein] transacylase